ncbi:hypothetical protein N9030_01420, partial [bacterium]|nr:hypothetical protein [bacterium]
QITAARPMLESSSPKVPLIHPDPNFRSAESSSLNKDFTINTFDQAGNSELSIMKRLGDAVQTSKN